MSNFSQKNNSILITSFGENFIKINQTIKLTGSIILDSNGYIKEINNLVKSINDLTPNILEQFMNNYTSVKDILLIGCGSKFFIPSLELRSLAIKKGFNLEWMITRSAIHSFNFLMEDYRDILALLFWD